MNNATAPSASVTFTVPVEESWTELSVDYSFEDGGCIPDSDWLGSFTLVPASGGPRPETCNGIDDDADGAVDEGFDQDGDGVTTCGGDGVASNADDDCDDSDADSFPGATEVCDDGADNDCDGASVADESADADLDGVPNACDGQPQSSCPLFTVGDVAEVRGLSGANCFVEATGTQLPAALTEISSYSGVYIEHTGVVFEVIGVARNSANETFVTRGCSDDGAPGTCTTLNRPLLPAGSEADLAGYEACKTVAEYGCR